MAAIEQQLETALARHQAGQLDEAERLYLAVLNIDPRQPDALHLLGVAAYQRDDNQCAVDYINQAISVNRSPTYYCNLAAACQGLGDLTSAIDALNVALELEPDSEVLLYNLGRLHQDLGDWDQAVVCYQRAIDISPTSADAWNNLGMVERERGQLDRAIDCYQKSLQFQPDLAEAWNNLGTARQDQLNWPAAVECHIRATEIRPDFAQAFFNLGNAHRRQDLFEESIECYQTSLALDPDSPDVVVNLGLAHQGLQRWDAALSIYQRALAIDSSSVEGHVNRAYLNRLTGNLADGWDEYEWRFRAEPQQRTFEQPLWNGRRLTNETLFIYPEQGIGDEVMFASCIPDVLSKVGNCTIECDPRLVPLYERSFPQANIIRSTEDAIHVLPDCDVQTPIGSLPRWTRRQFSDFPGRRTFLIADERRITHWKDRLNQIGSGLNVGISWRGGRKPETIRQRSTGLKDWMPIISTKGMSLFSLQYGECKQEIAECQSSTGVQIQLFPEIDPLVELDDFCAFVSALDLVISIDNSTVHLAGALGVEVWTLLPFNPDWRWLLERTDSPWYPSMQLYRQPCPNDWETVFANVTHVLSERVNQG